MKIIIVDNNTIIREGLKSMLFSEGWEVTEQKEVEGLGAVVDLIKPEIVLLEINLCDTPIKALLQQIKTASTNTKTLIVSDCKCEMPVIMAISAGVAGFVGKDIEKEELINAIKKVGLGKQYFSQDITSIITENFVTMKNTNYELSDREIEVLKYICKGRSNEQIGDILFLSEKTVATHKRNMMKKIGVKKTTDLILWAVEKGIIAK